MDIPTLANDIWNLLQPLLPVIAAKGTEEIGKRAATDLWDAIRQRPETQKLTEEIVAEPENPDLQGAFKYHLREALKSDPTFAAQLQTLLENAQKETYHAEMHGDGGLSQGENARSVGAHGVMAEKVDGGIHYHYEYVTHLNQTIPPIEKPAPRSSLPKQPYFFGREKELEIVAAALSPEARTWGALIDGPGGIGKTALAIKAAHDAPPERFLRKIFITAKVRELTTDGEKPLTDFTRPSYLAMLDETAREIGEEGLLTRLPPDDRPNALRLALEGKQALLIFDNLETLPEDERVRLFQFLARLPDGNKAIVTSRRRSDVDARVVRLDRLSSEAALQLMSVLDKRYPRLTQATKKEREEIYLLTQGNPLLITWIVGQLGNSRSQCRTIADVTAFLKQAPSQNDPLEYIFGDLLETFSESYTRVLAALSHFENPAKLVWLAELSRLPARVAETVLNDLAERSVVNTDPESHTYLLPPLTAHFLRVRRPQTVGETGDQLESHAYALVMQHGGHHNYEGFKKLEAEWLLIAAALPRFLQGENVRLQTIYDQLDRFLDYSGRWDDIISIAQNAELRALQAGDLENAGERAFQAGWVYALRDQSVDVLLCAARAKKYWRSSKSPKNVDAIRLHGIGYQIQENYPAALDAFRKVLEIHQASNLESISVSTALADLGNIAYEMGNYSSAQSNYFDALHLARKFNNHSGIASITGFLATVALDDERWTDAEDLAREALALSEKIGQQQLIAKNYYRIAKALLHQNRSLEEAASLARRALEIQIYLRVPYQIGRIRKTLDEIESRLKGD